MLLLATVLVSPHLTVYDLVILAPTFLLISERFIGHASEPKVHVAGLLLYLCYLAPLIGPLSQWTRIQISVPAFVALLWIVVRISGAPRSTHFQRLAPA